MDIGYKDDDLFLLSKKEYEHYKNKIPPEAYWWWLRNFGPRKNRAAIHCSGYPIDVVVSVFSAVRPALKYSNLESQIIKSTIHKDRFLFHEFPFRIIDAENKIAIAEVPIAFDKFDKESNDYETSGIRRKLLKWFETGIWNYA